MVVVSLTSDAGYGDVAERIAADRGDELVTDLDALEPGDVAVVVSDPMAIAERTAMRLQHRLDRLGPEEGAYAFVTGLTPEAALELYRRDPRDRERHAIVVRQEDRKRFSYDEDAAVYTRQTATVENLRDDLDAGLESLSTMVDARSIHGYLSDGYVCGVPTRHDVSDFEEPHPPCVSDGELDCPLDGELVRASEMDVDHVFMNSCMSMFPSNDENGLPVHVGLNLLERSASVIGGFRPLDGLVHQTVLHYDLLRAGYSAIERTYLLNQQADALNVEYQPFVLFGRPDHGVVDPSPTEYDATVRSTDDGAVVEVSDLDANVVDVSIPGDALPAAETAAVRNLEDDHEDAPIYYVTFREGDDLRLLVYTWGRIDVASLTFEVLPEHEEQAEYERIETALENAKSLREISLGDRSFKGQIKNLENHLAGFGPLLDRQRYEANAYRKTATRLGKARKHARRVRDEIREMLEDRGPSFLSNDYGEDSIASDVWIAEEPCYACGRPVYVKEFRNSSGDTRRLRGNCPTCVNTYDVPRVGDEIVHPKVEGDLRFESGREGTVELRFRNPLDRRMDALYFFWLCSAEGDVRGSPVFTPDGVEVTLDPGEERAAEFEVRPPEKLPEDDYTLYGYVLGNLQIFAGMQTVHLQNVGVHG